MKKTKENKFTILSYMKKYWFSITLYLLFFVAFYGLNIFASLKIADLMTMVSSGGGILSQALKLVFVVGGIWLFSGIFQYTNYFMFHKISSKMALSLKLDLVNQSFKINSKAYSGKGSGSFINRIVNDPENIFNFFDAIAEQLAVAISNLATLCLVMTMNVYIGLIAIGFLVIFSIIDILRIKFWRKQNKEVRKISDEIYSLTNEAVRSEKDIKSLNLHEKMHNELEDNYSKYTNKKYKMNWKINLFDALRSFIATLYFVSIVGAAIIFYDKTMLSLTAFTYIFLNRNSMQMFVHASARIYSRFSELKILKERMYELFDEEEYPTEHFGNEKLIDCKGKIEFKKVNFAYLEPEETIDKSTLTKKQLKELKNKPKKYIRNEVLKDISFKIEPNTTVAFVGKSGSGKSTILSLISKLYDLDENCGQILLDGKDVQTLDRDSLRNNISLVNQFPYIFNFSIKENLKMAKKDATDEEIIDALKRASLWEFVSSLKKGLDTKVGEGGIKLSGGQKQRLAIARALLKNSKIILFDESTSSLDNFAQEDIRKSIKSLSGGNTVVIVAHRLSTIKDADKIFFLDEGKIVGKGTFSELYSKNEKFKSMFNAENI